MRAYLELTPEKFNAFKPPLGERDFVGYIPANMFPEYKEVLSHLVLLNEKTAPDPNLYIPLTAGLVVRDDTRIVSRKSLMCEEDSLFTVELIDFEGGVYNDPIATIFASLKIVMKNEIRMNEEDLQRISMNPMLYMGVFLKFDGFKLAEIKLVYCLYNRNGSMHLMLKDAMLRNPSIKYLGRMTLTEFSKALIPSLPIVQ